MTITRHAVKAGLAAALALLLSAGPVLAEPSGPPPLPNVMAGPVIVPAAPASLTPLVDRITNPSSSGVSSQDFVSSSQYNQLDSLGADDFCIPPSEPAWLISQVDVAGGYTNPSYSTPSVKVSFYRDVGSGLPGPLIYTAEVAPFAGTGTGSFQMTVSPPLLASGACYWLSVQAVQTGAGSSITWLWAEYNDAAADHSPSAYQQPYFPGSPCNNWGARVTTCHVGVLPDLTYRLSGSKPLYFVYLPLIRR